MINSFEGKYEFLSNFSPSVIEYEGFEYPTVEHAFQAAKTLDLDKRLEVAELPTPGDAKRAGRRLDLRPDWEQVKLQVMEDCLREKFKHTDLLLKLVGTGDAILVEGNWWHDQTWGSCYCDKCGNNGLNQLGKLLMKIRDEYIDTMKNL